MDEKDRKRTESTSVLQLCLEFGGNTTMHGAGRALTSKRPFRRVGWFMLVLCVAAWAVYQLVTVVNVYYTYPVVTLVTLKHDDQMLFPAVTICNLNRLKKSSTSELFNKFTSVFQKKKMHDIRAYVNAFLRMEKIANDISTGHKMSDMLVNCMFNGRACSADHFTDQEAGLAGLCYTFTGDGGNNTLVFRPGSKNGLVIEMSIELDEYISTTAQAGVKVVIHEHDEAPFPMDRGILVQPGVSTSIAVKKIVTHRLPPPYGKCTRQEESSEIQLNLFEGNGFKYTEIGCLKSSFQLATVYACNCCDVNIPCDSDKIFKFLKIERESNEDIPICKATSQDVVCLGLLEDKFIKGEKNFSKYCSPACDQTTFDLTVSTALWPSDAYLEIFKYHFRNTTLMNQMFNSLADMRNVISKNFLRMEIFYETPDFDEIVTKPMYDLSNLLGNIGGQLGLWLGFSILTALELLELCYDIAVVLARRLMGRDMTDRDKMFTANV